MMHRDDYKSWVAEIELASVDRLYQLAELFKLPSRPGNSPPPTEGNFHKLHDLIQRRLERTPIRDYHDPWNAPSWIGGNMIPPLSHRYGK